MAEIRVTMSLAEASPGRIDDQRQVREARRRVAERAVHEDLTRRARHQVVAADDLGDAHRSIVDDHGELIRGHSVVATEHYVVGYVTDVAEDQIVNGDRRRVGT